MRLWPSSKRNVSTPPQYSTPDNSRNSSSLLNSASTSIAEHERQQGTPRSYGGHKTDLGGNNGHFGNGVEANSSDIMSQDELAAAAAADTTSSSSALSSYNSPGAATEQSTTFMMPANRPPNANASREGGETNAYPSSSSSASSSSPYAPNGHHTNLKQEEEGDGGKGAGFFVKENEELIDNREGSQQEAANNNNTYNNYNYLSAAAAAAAAATKSNHQRTKADVSYPTAAPPPHHHHRNNSLSAPASIVLTPHHQHYLIPTNGTPSSSDDKEFRRKQKSNPLQASYDQYYYGSLQRQSGASQASNNNNNNLNRHKELEEADVVNFNNRLPSPPSVPTYSVPHHQNQIHNHYQHQEAGNNNTRRPPKRLVLNGGNKKRVVHNGGGYWSEQEFEPAEDYQLLLVEESGSRRGLNPLYPPPLKDPPPPALKSRQNDQLSVYSAEQDGNNHLRDKFRRYHNGYASDTETINLLNKYSATRKLLLNGNQTPPSELQRSTPNYYSSMRLPSLTRRSNNNPRSNDHATTTYHPPNWSNNNNGSSSNHRSMSLDRRNGGGNCRPILDRFDGGNDRFGDRGRGRNRSMNVGTDHKGNNKPPSTMQKLKSFSEQIGLLEQLTRAWDRNSKLGDHQSKLNNNNNNNTERMVRFASKDDVVSYASGGSAAASPPLARPEVGGDHEDEYMSSQPPNHLDWDKKARYSGGAGGGAGGTSSRAGGAYMPGDIASDSSRAIRGTEAYHVGGGSQSPIHSRFGGLGLVFLQQGEETKRALLPARLTGVREVKDLFTKAFPTTLQSDYVHSNRVKVYIQDKDKLDIFYELEDVSEVRDRSVLRLREQQGGGSGTAIKKSGDGVGSGSFENSNHINVHSDNSLFLPSSPSSSSSTTTPAAKTNNGLVPAMTTNGGGGGAAAGNSNSNNNNPRIIHQSVQSSSPSTTTMSPAKAKYLEDDMNYFSEPELLDAEMAARGRSVTRNFPYGSGGAGNSSTLQPYRPASALPLHHGTSASGPPKPQYSSPLYPASVGGGRSVGGRMSGGGVGNGGLPPRSPPPNLRNLLGRGGSVEAGSDRSSTTSSIRSGSVTPVVIDEEARARVIEMENQLSSLSTLVHSALMNKNVNESVFKDIEMIRREILGGGGGGSINGRDIDSVSDAGSISRFSDLSSEKGSYVPERRENGSVVTNGSTNNSGSNNRQTHNHSPPTKDVLNPALQNFTMNGGGPPMSSNLSSLTTGSVMIDNERYDIMRSRLRGMKIKVGDMKAEVRHIRRLAQINAQTQRDCLKDSFHKIHLLLNQNYSSVLRRAGDGGAGADDSPERLAVNGQQIQHKAELKQIETSLSEFERDVEGLRQAVVNGERKLKLSEVEAFTATLSGLGRNAASLKTMFPELHDKLKRVMSSEMEKVVREEKFLKEEPDRLDAALRRCKKLTKTMVTMKKLAMVQDPSAAAKKNIPKQAPIAAGEDEPDARHATNVPPIPPAPPGYSSPTLEQMQRSAIIQPPSINNDVFMPAERERTPTKPPPILRSSSATSAATAANHHNSNSQHEVLDSLLEDLQTVAKGEGLKGNDPLANVGRGGSNGAMMSMKSIPRASLHHHDPPVVVDPRPFSAMGERISSSNNYHGSAGRDRSRSGTPNSVASEPAVARRSGGGGMIVGIPPPAPPRSSSRQQMSGGGGNDRFGSAVAVTPAHVRTDAINDHQNHQHNHHHHQHQQQQHSNNYININGAKSSVSSVNSNSNNNGQQGQSGVMVSASSSESINSQESLQHPSTNNNNNDMLAPPNKPAPPPPPPRNRQELLQQRHQELLQKQKQIATPAPPPPIPSYPAGLRST